MSDAKAAAQGVLFTCVDAGLRLLAPFMPFLAEELWQRLPRRQSETAESVHVTAFPRDLAGANPALEQVVAFVKEVIDVCRSMKAKYSIKPKQIAEVSRNMFFRAVPFCPFLLRRS